MHKNQSLVTVHRVGRDAVLAKHSHNHLSKATDTNGIWNTFYIHQLPQIQTEHIFTHLNTFPIAQWVNVWGPNITLFLHRHKNQNSLTSSTIKLKCFYQSCIFIIWQESTACRIYNSTYYILHKNMPWSPSANSNETWKNGSTSSNEWT